MGKIRGFLTLLCFLMVLIVGGLGYLRYNAEAIGKEYGKSVGTLAGKAVGSIEGLTVGLAEGTEAGREAGLSAEDTEADIASELQQLEKLEVLVASVKLNDMHKVGDKYAALYLLKGDVIFTVDLAQSEIITDSKSIHVTVPEPVAELKVDQSQIEKVAEYQKHFFSGSADAGMDAYLNSMAKVKEHAEETISNYDELVESARISAEKQIIQLASAVATSVKKIEVEFK